ncbi:MAG: hypothetical protein JNL28_09120 [Planctomycetes bacterium]|nr:hypothetical protein [Planctomycetota bacterium]
MAHRTIIKRAQVELADSNVRAPAIADASIARCSKPKRAVIVEHEGRPFAIEVTCSCGETTVVELDFESGADGQGEKRA